MFQREMKPEQCSLGLGHDVYTLDVAGVVSAKSAGAHKTGDREGSKIGQGGHGNRRYFSLFALLHFEKGKSASQFETDRRKGCHRSEDTISAQRVADLKQAVQFLQGPKEEFVELAESHASNPAPNARWKSQWL
jgi:hypothetical protein